MSTGCVAVAVLLPACTRVADALVTNPCMHAVIVLLDSGSEPPTRREDWDDEVAVDPGTPVLVEGVFVDIGDDPFVAKVETPKGKVRVFNVPHPEDIDEPVPVEVPTFACDPQEAF